MRIGAVNYLNSKPLVYGLETLAPEVRLSFDLPSRLADALAAGRLDVALVPSVEYFRSPGCEIVSDACVACRGPVLSVKLHFRVAPGDVARVALDEGSRTSAALTQILLAELCGVRPRWKPLPIGCGLDTTDADAVLLIGDRAISSVQGGRGKGEGNPQFAIPNRKTDGTSVHDFVEVWDLGEKWSNWTGLPFVFAMWVARPGVDLKEMACVLGEARDNGVKHLKEIAEREAPLLGISHELAMRYLNDYLHFELGHWEQSGLRKFHELCVKHRMTPEDAGTPLAAGRLDAFGGIRR